MASGLRRRVLDQIGGHHSACAAVDPDFEIPWGQVADGPAVVIDHLSIDGHEIDTRAEGRLLRRGPGRESQPARDEAQRQTGEPHARSVSPVHHTHKRIR